MKSKNWLGLVTALSSYSSPNGSAVEQNNLQLVLPGSAAVRPALYTLLNRQDGSFVFGLYRKTNGLAAEDTLYAHVETIQQLGGVSGQGVLAKVSLQEVEDDSGNTREVRQFETIYTFDEALDMRIYPAFCEDRHGNTYVYYGNGIRPLVIESSTETATTVGLDAPTVSPTLSPSGSGFFIERIDVLDGGGSYWAAPNITVESPSGTYTRQASGRAVVENGLVVAVEMLDYGTGYTRAPKVVISGATKKGTGFSARCNVQTTPQTFGHTNFNFFDPANGTALSPYTANNATETTSPSWVRSTREYRFIGDGSGETSESTTVSVSSEQGATHDITFVGLKEYMAGDVLECDFLINAVATTEKVVVLSHRVVGGSSVVAVVSSAEAAAGTATVEHAANQHTHSSVNTTQSEAECVVAVIAARAVLSAGYTTRTMFNGTYIESYDPETRTITTSHPLDDGTTTLVHDAASSGAAFQAGQVLEIVDWDHDDDVGTADVPAVFAYTPTPQSVVYGLEDGTENFDGEAPLADGDGQSATAFLEFNVTDDAFQATISQTTNTLLTGDNNNYYQGGSSYVNYGLHAHASQYKWGWQNRISDHRSCDFYLFWTNCYYDGWTYRNYFPDYRYITVWKHIGEYGNYDQENWTPVVHPVAVDNGTPSIEVELEPSLYDDGTAVEPSAQHTKPRVKIEFAYAPTAWDRTWVGRWIGEFANGSADDMGANWWRQGIGESSKLSGLKEIEFWANKGGDTARPLVNVTSITLLDKGQGFPADTKWRIRIPQAQASYDYTVGPVAAGETAPTTASFSQPLLGFNAYYWDVQFDNNEPSGNAVGKTLGDVATLPTILNPGTGYSQGDTSNVLIMQRSKAGSIYKFSRYWSFAVRKLTDTLVSDKIGSVTILSSGKDYFAPPTLIETPSSGYGLKATAVVDTLGKITSVIIGEQQRGSGYEQGNEPFLVTSDNDATFTPVMRPVMQGVYRCAYRFADLSRTYIGDVTAVTFDAGSKTATLVWTGEKKQLVDAVIEHESLPHMTKIKSASKTGTNAYTVTLTQNATASQSLVNAKLRDTTQQPIYSDFSPIEDIDCGPNASRASTGEIIWNIPDADLPTRATKVELFRTAGDQSLVFYRLEAYGSIEGGRVVITGNDTLNDEELFDPSRPHYAAVPIVLPNGNLNAYRFGVSRSDMAICCAFQDRLWYGGSTSGDAPNTVFFSEYDEFESCPAENEIPIQNNQRVTDYLTALIPYGSVLIVAQSSHCYQLSYNTDPAVDAAVTLVANRGCANNRCWDLYDDVLYAMDERGVYSMERSGRVEELSQAIANVFVDGEIDFTKKDLLHLKIDRKKALLRVFVPTANAGEAPDLVYCYSLEYQRWWTETYPCELTCSVNYKRHDTSNEVPIYGTSDGTVRVFDGQTELPFQSIKTVTILDGGSGYTSPPTLTMNGIGRGVAGKLRAIIRNGSVIDVEIVDRGHNYGSYINNMGDFDDQIAVSVSAPDSANGQYAAIQATAYYPKFFEQGDTADGGTPDTAHLTVGWSLKTPNLELATDATVKNGEAEIDRSISVTYQPTATDSTLVLKHFYNNSQEPRQNVMPRDRGTGFKHIADSTRTELNMASNRVPLGHATGIATAKFAGRSYSDLGGADRHLAIEFSQIAVEVDGDSTQPEARIYEYEINGVVQRDE
jgi:hypothetical protein